MESRFFHHFKIVALAHVIVVFALMIGPCRPFLTKKKPELVVPVEFVVEVPATKAAPPSPLPVPTRPKPIPPKPEPIPVPPKPKPEPEKPKPKPIAVSREKITRVQDDKPKTNPLTEEQIRKLLEQGAKPSDHTSIPDEEARCLELIRQTLYGAWVQPSAEEAAGAVAQATIKLTGDGLVISHELSRPSGNVAVDSTVRQALAAVKRIPGLTPAFVARHMSVTISFKVED